MRFFVNLALEQHYCLHQTLDSLLVNLANEERNVYSSNHWHYYMVKEAEWGAEYCVYVRAANDTQVKSIKFVPCVKISVSRRTT